MYSYSVQGECTCLACSSIIRSSLLIIVGTLEMVKSLGSFTYSVLACYPAVNRSDHHGCLYGTHHLTFRAVAINRAQQTNTRNHLPLANLGTMYRFLKFYVLQCIERQVSKNIISENVGGTYGIIIRVATQLSNI